MKQHQGEFERIQAECHVGVDGNVTFHGNVPGRLHVLRMDSMHPSSLQQGADEDMQGHANTTASHIPPSITTAGTVEVLTGGGALVGNG